MASSYEILKIRGIPIRVHVTLLILLPIIALSFSRQMGMASIFPGLWMAVGLFASVALHELGHSLVALAKGCRVRQILLLPIGGMAQLDQMPARPRDEIQMALAGPAVSLALYVLGNEAGYWLHGTRLELFGLLAGTLGDINLMLFLFNLIPSFPMDGGRVFRAVLTPRLGRVLSTRIAAGVGRFLAVLFGIFGLFHFNLFLVVIAIFIYQAAGAEYRMVVLQEMARRGPPPFAPWMRSGPRPLDEQEVEVGPPPYGQDRDFVNRSIRRGRDWFDDLFENWR